MEVFKIVCMVVVFVSGLVLLLAGEWITNVFHRIVVMTIGWIAIIISLGILASIIAKGAISWHG